MPSSGPFGQCIYVIQMHTYGTHMLMQAKKKSLIDSSFFFSKKKKQLLHANNIVLYCHIMGGVGKLI